MDGVRSTGGTLITYLRQVLGTYTPLQDQSTGEYIQTAAGVDWEYIVSAILLILTVYFVFRFIMILFKR